LTTAPEQLQLEINPDDHTISAQPLANWWGGEPGVEVVVQASDGEGATITDTFLVVVTPVNDAPEPFAMLSPENGHAVLYDPDSLGMLDFAWEAALQNEFETDTVRYFVQFWTDQSADTFLVGPLDSIHYDDISIQLLADTLGLDRSADITFLWQVWAVDSETFTLASDAPWSFTIPALGIATDPRLEAPDHYTLQPNFPNPFNARTTIRFGLPTAGAVKIEMWDVTGRRIVTLADGVQQAGWHDAVWDAGSAPSGIYIVTMSAKEFRAVRKVMLIR